MALSSSVLRRRVIARAPAARPCSSAPRGRRRRAPLVEAVVASDTPLGVVAARPVRPRHLGPRRTRSSRARRPSPAASSARGCRSTRRARAGGKRSAFPWPTRRGTSTASTRPRPSSTCRRCPTRGATPPSSASAPPKRYGAKKLTFDAEAAASRRPSTTASRPSATARTPAARQRRRQGGRRRVVRGRRGPRPRTATPTSGAPDSSSAMWPKYHEPARAARGPVKLPRVDRRANAVRGGTSRSCGDLRQRAASSLSSDSTSSSPRAASQSRPVAATDRGARPCARAPSPVLEVGDLRLLRLRRWRRRHCRLFFVRGPVALALPVRPARAFSRLVLGDPARRVAGSSIWGAGRAPWSRREREEADAAWLWRISATDAGCGQR